ncbi:MAG: hypothetical protein CMJ72_02655 [Planctomycetaceae bacterium]|nr:hypothetical protein [Planctomycetaceae bacterium]HCK42009.1 hypothetical protein [Planctomycetaceae bacterium]|tara:strand:- start:201 stop:395 length:195 start_codon:yes stop_codon:yes gene_type:complete
MALAVVRRLDGTEPLVDGLLREAGRFFFFLTFLGAAFVLAGFFFLRFAVAKGASPIALIQGGGM